MSAPADPYLLLLLVTHPAHYLSQGANILGIPLGDSHHSHCVQIGEECLIPYAEIMFLYALRKKLYTTF